MGDLSFFYESPISRLLKRTVPFKTCVNRFNFPPENHGSVGNKLTVIPGNENGKLQGELILQKNR